MDFFHFRRRLYLDEPPSFRSPVIAQALEDVDADKNPLRLKCPFENRRYRMIINKLARARQGIGRMPIVGLDEDTARKAMTRQGSDRCSHL